jgi:hypothetical protein
MRIADSNCKAATGDTRSPVKPAHEAELPEGSQVSSPDNNQKVILLVLMVRNPEAGRDTTGCRQKYNVG